MKLVLVSSGPLGEVNLRTKRLFCNRKAVFVFTDLLIWCVSDNQNDNRFSVVVVAQFTYTAEIKLNLREPNAEKETPINVIIRFNGQKLVYSSGKRIHPSMWDNLSQKAAFEINGYRLKTNRS